MSDRVLHLNCGPEIGVAATKSFISELAIFYLLGFAMINRLDEGIDKIKAVASLIEENFKHNGETVRSLSDILKDKQDFYYIARGINFAVAGEGALKLKEVAYVHAEGMPAGELKHGTLALIEKGTPVVAICPTDYTFQEILSNASEARARGALIIGVSDQRQQVFDEWIKIPAAEEIFYPLVSIIPLQLLAYYSAIARQLDPDKPRNLAKSVTVR
jgi:glucosamine--fructose-6-phosphate aminotransferase (isomerizing)